MAQIAVRGFSIDRGRIKGVEIHDGENAVELVSGERHSMAELRSLAAQQLRQLADDLEKHN